MSLRHFVAVTTFVFIFLYVSYLKHEDSPRRDGCSENIRLGKHPTSLEHHAIQVSFQALRRTRFEKWPWFTWRTAAKHMEIIAVVSASSVVGHRMVQQHERKHWYGSLARRYHVLSAPMIHGRIKQIVKRETGTAGLQPRFFSSKWNIGNDWSLLQKMHMFLVIPCFPPSFSIRLATPWSPFWRNFWAKPPRALLSSIHANGWAHLQKTTKTFRVRQVPPTPRQSFNNN